MSRSKIIVVDLCDTLANVTQAVEGIYGPRPDPLRFFHPAVVSRDYWADPGNRIAHEIFKYADPLPGAAREISRLAKIFRVVYLTARPGWAKPVSESWLRLNKFPAAPIICSPDKYAWVQKICAVAAIEDNPDQILSLQQLVPVFVASQPWNEGLGIQLNWAE